MKTGDHRLDAACEGFRLMWVCDEFFPATEQSLFESINNHAKDKRFQHLASFLHNALVILREELATMDRETQQAVPSFTNILDVVGFKGIELLCLGGSIQHYLLVVLHLALYIGDQEHTSPSHEGPSLLVSLSAGSLSAAAIAVATSLADLACVGAECARVAFRIGVCIEKTSRLLEPPMEGGSLQSWAYAITTLSVGEVQAEIAAFNHDTCNNGVTQLYISAADNACVVVTGPPSRLRAAFQESPKLRDAKWVALPIYDGLAHAPHLYDENATADIMRPLHSNSSLLKEVRVPLLSSYTGQPYPAKHGYELLAQVTSTILTKAINVDAVHTTIVARFSGLQESVMEFWTFEPCRASCQALQTIEAIQTTGPISRYDLSAWTKEWSAPRRPLTPKQSKLAVVGMSCRMPGGGDSPQEFWHLLEHGRDTCREVPSDRFDLEQHYDPTGNVPNTTRIRFGNFVDKPGQFDAAFFNLSPREADNTDPAARLALVCAYEALEMAGFTCNRTRSTITDRVGTYLGQASDDWRELNASQNINAFIVPGGVRAFANGRINYFFKLGGPSFNIDTACSSGLAAVQAACSALWANEVDTAIAGGVNIITDPDNYAGLGAAGFLSATGQCKVWDEAADGYCRADGVGMIVIKRLEDAEADNDNILAVILSGATNHSAFAPSITHPHAGAQIDNYHHVVREAGVDPLDVSYVELHGTGTQAGDAVEALSIEAVFAPALPRRRPDQKLYLGAVKSNIGHSEAAAGIASMLKVLLCFQQERIPAHIGIHTRINPKIPQGLLTAQGAVLPLKNVPWPRQSNHRRLAVVNSFGAHGGNTTLLLEDAPPVSRRGVDPRSVFPIVISARSTKSLSSNMRRLEDHLRRDPSTALGDLSYTLCARRMHHNYRAGTLCSSTTDVQRWLNAAVAAAEAIDRRPVQDHKIVFVFTGQGSFRKDVAAQLIRDCSWFRSEILRLNQIVLSYGCSPVLIDSTGAPVANIDPSPTTVQLTIVVVEIALASLLAKLNIKPDLVIGHSLGEYAALVGSGVLSAADALRIVIGRGRMLESKCTVGSRGMMQIFSTDAMSTTNPITDVLSIFDDLELVCINSSKTWVIGGTVESLARAESVLSSAKFTCSKVNVPFAFHTSQMDCIMDDLDNLLHSVPFRRVLVPYLSPILRRTLRGADVIDAEYLKKACRETVDLQGAIDNALSEGMLDANAIFCEIGPHPIVARYIKELLPGAQTFATLSHTESNWTTLTDTMVGLHNHGASVNWAEHFSEYEKAHRLCQLPTYAWNDRNHWIPYTGRWTLDKAASSEPRAAGRRRDDEAPFRTSLIHHILEEDIQMGKATIIFSSDLADPDFRKVMKGHIMNKSGVASWAVYHEMAVSAAEYVFKRLQCHSDGRLVVVNLQCFTPQLLDKEQASRQHIRLEGRLELDTRKLQLQWFSTHADDSQPSEPCAVGTVVLDNDVIDWSSVYATMEPLLVSRIAALDDCVTNCTASKLHKAVVYRTFENIVDYAAEYKGIESLVISGYEAYANVRLCAKPSGQWHSPPCWIDSLCQIAGFVMNGGEHCDYRKEFYVTPGFEAFRLTKPLQAESAYLSYVKMAPTPDPRLFAGDIFVMSDGKIIGLVQQVKFRQFPRVLMDEFFSLPSKAVADRTSDRVQRPAKSGHEPCRADPFRSDETVSSVYTSKTGATVDVKAPAHLQPASASRDVGPRLPSKASPNARESEHWLANCFEQLLATELGLSKGDLDDRARLADVGVDSMVALVLTTKLQAKTGVSIKHTALLELDGIGEAKKWLMSDY